MTEITTDDIEVGTYSHPYLYLCRYRLQIESGVPAVVTGATNPSCLAAHRGPLLGRYICIFICLKRVDIKYQYNGNVRC